jgi:hypothetical protein
VEGHYLYTVVSKDNAFVSLEVKLTHHHRLVLMGLYSGSYVVMHARSTASLTATRRLPSDMLFDISDLGMEF